MTTVFQLIILFFPVIEFKVKKLYMVFKINTKISIYLIIYFFPTNIFFKDKICGFYSYFKKLYIFDVNISILHNEIHTF